MASDPGVVERPRTERMHVRSETATPSGIRRVLAGRPLWLVIVLSAAGALIGSLMVIADPPRPTATVQFAVLPDPLLPDDPSQGTTTRDDDRFVQTQLLILGGDDLRDQVVPPSSSSEVPDVQAVQVGATDVVSVSITGSAPRAATQAAARLLKTYQKERAKAFRARVDSLAAALDQQLATVRASLDVLQPLTRTADQSGLQSSSATEYARLLAERNDVALVASADQQFTRTIQAPRAVEQDAGAEVLRDGVLGLLAGLALGVALVLLLRRVQSV